MILVEVLFEVFVKLLQPLIAKKYLGDDNPKNRLPTYSDSANILNIFFSSSTLQQLDSNLIDAEMN